LNIVNTRPFCAVDAEHFLCKSWIIAKLTFGHNQGSKYPLQGNHYAHPSPVLHALQNWIVAESMNKMENAYVNNIRCKVNGMRLPDFCTLPGEER
jgi:hypothetical protein